MRGVPVWKTDGDQDLMGRCDMNGWLSRGQFRRKRGYYRLHGPFLSEHEDERTPSDTVWWVQNSIVSRARSSIKLEMGGKKRLVLLCSDSEQLELWYTSLQQASRRVFAECYSVKRMKKKTPSGQLLTGLDTRTGDRVLIKVVSKRNYSVDDMRTLYRNLRIGLNISHDNILKTLDVFDSGERLYIVLEDWEGCQTLEDDCKRQKHVPEELIGAYVKDILQALTFLHSLEVIHGDVSAENILVGAGRDGRAQAKLCDFGYGALHDPGIRYQAVKHQQVSFDSSWCYVAPEQLERELGTSIDIWAAGVCMFYMMYKSYPFTGGKIAEVLQKIRYRHLTFPESTQTFSPRGRAFVQMLLEKEASTRVGAKTALAHPWITMIGPRPEAVLRSDEDAPPERPDAARESQRHLAELKPLILSSQREMSSASQHKPGATSPRNDVGAADFYTATSRTAQKSKPSRQSDPLNMLMLRASQKSHAQTGVPAAAAATKATAPMDATEPAGDASDTFSEVGVAAAVAAVPQPQVRPSPPPLPHAVPPPPLPHAVPAPPEPPAPSAQALPPVHPGTAAPAASAVPAASVLPASSVLPSVPSAPQDQFADDIPSGRNGSERSSRSSFFVRNGSARSRSSSLRSRQPTVPVVPAGEKKDGAVEDELVFSFQVHASDASNEQMSFAERTSDLDLVSDPNSPGTPRVLRWDELQKDESGKIVQPAEPPRVEIYADAARREFRERQQTGEIDASKLTSPDRRARMLERRRTGSGSLQNFKVREDRLQNIEDNEVVHNNLVRSRSSAKIRERNSLLDYGRRSSERRSDRRSGSSQDSGKLRTSFIRSVSLKGGHADDGEAIILELDPYENRWFH